MSATNQYYQFPDRTVFHLRKDHNAWDVSPNLNFSLLPERMN